MTAQSKAFESKGVVTLKTSEKDYLIAMLVYRLQHLKTLLEHIEKMGDHAFINDGLINEGAHTQQTHREEIAQIESILRALEEMG